MTWIITGKEFDNEYVLDKDYGDYSDNQEPMIKLLDSYDRQGYADVVAYELTGETIKL